MNGGDPIRVLELGTVQLPDSHPRAVDGTCAIQAFLVRHPDGFILFDTGVGAGHELIDELYQPTVTPIVTALNDAGVDERDVTAIVNSHLHFDHCGQNQALPAAAVYVQAAELQAAAVPGFTVAEWAFIAPERQRVLHGDDTIAPGVTILATPGHTPGHQSLLVEIESGQRHLIVGQACFRCAEFASGTAVPSEFHDESLGGAYVDSLERLRHLDVVAGRFSHDPTVFRPEAR